MQFCKCRSVNNGIKLEGIYYSYLSIATLRASAHGTGK